MKTDLFQSCGHCWVFQICWHIECGTFTASSFRIWNSSMPSPPLALLVVMLPKAHLTSHSRMSGSRWVITPSWLSWLWRSFLYSSSVYSCHLLISSASIRSIPFLCYAAAKIISQKALVSLCEGCWCWDWKLTEGSWVVTPRRSESLCLVAIISEATSHTSALWLVLPVHSDPHILSSMDAQRKCSLLKSVSISCRCSK